MSEKEEFSKLSSLKKCPLCGGELEKGYIIGDGTGSISWSPKESKSWGKGELVVRGSVWTLPKVKAYRCISCKLVLFHYGRSENYYRAPRYTPKSFLKNCVKCGKEIPIASEECQQCGTKQPEYRKP